MALADERFHAAVEIEPSPAKQAFYRFQWSRTIDGRSPASSGRRRLLEHAEKIADAGHAEARLFVARIREAEKKWDEAIAIYDALLRNPRPQSLDEAHTKYEAYRGRCRARSRQLIELANATRKVPEDARSTIRQAIADADAMIQLASNELRCRVDAAESTQLAAETRLGYFQISKDQSVLREGLDLYRQLIRTNPNHRDAATWRCKLVKFWADHLENRTDFMPSAEARSYLKQALEQLPDTDPKRADAVRLWNESRIWN